MSKIIGIDISKETFDAVFLDESENFTHSSKPNNFTGFKQLFKRLSITDKVIMEASGPYYLKLAHFLYQNGIQVSVVNPLIIRRFCQMRMVRAKTDKKDAIMIAKYGKLENPPLWQPDEQITTYLKQIHMATEQLDKQTTALSNQLEALEGMGVVDKEVVKSIKRTVAKLKSEKEKLERRMEVLVKENYKETYDALLTIPAIGPKTAAMLIAITNNFKKFEHYKQLISYIGLSPRIFDSGTSVKGKAKICKMGMGKIRKLLYLCSWSAKRFNTQCSTLYERLKSKGKPERVIKIAIANKLIRQAFSIGKNLSKYEKNYIQEFAF